MTPVTVSAGVGSLVWRWQVGWRALPGGEGSAVAASRRAVSGMAMAGGLVAARRHLRLALAGLAGARLGLALAAHAGRLVSLAATRLREDTVLLYFAGESLQCDFK